MLDRSAEARERIGSELPGLSGILDANVADRDAVEAAFAKAVRQMGAVDVLINNAGISIRPRSSTSPQTCRPTPPRS